MSNKKPPIIITLTLPEEDGTARSGTLLIARGELAHLRQFTYANLSDITVMLKDALLVFAAIEADPPVIPDPPKSTSPSSNRTKGAPPPVDEEPPFEIPTRKGKVKVKTRHLQIAGEPDDATYQQAITIAGKLIDGNLWDGTTAIIIGDVDAVQRKLQHLTDKELSLFTLDDFVQVETTVEQPA